MGYLTAAALAPNLLFALHFGAWVDRRGHRRQTMIAADLGRAAALAWIPLAYALGLHTIVQLYAVAFVTGTLSLLFTVSYSTLFTALVPRERYVEANQQLTNGSRALSFIGGPSVGALLVQLSPTRLCTPEVTGSSRRHRCTKPAQRADFFCQARAYASRPPT
jgi:MFS family permease